MHHSQILENKQCGAPESWAEFVEIVDRGVHGTLRTTETKLLTGTGQRSKLFLLCQAGQGPERNQAATTGLPSSHLLGERKDMEQRHEFRQLILYLKNNKQPDFTY